MTEILQFLALVAGIAGLVVAAVLLNERFSTRSEDERLLPEEFQEEDEREHLQRVMNEVHERVMSSRKFIRDRMSDRIDKQPRTGSRGGRYTIGKTKDGHPYRRYF
ncbi:MULTISPECIES: hypothetical protein [Cyanobium]|jgi:hypothetical protein|uniref:Uncharacterized protein n=1 Tax=Cyanobium usitatum str. Tous TaxID=2116684 RepID=A0A2P7MXN3_9CYAN|nr:MULTISPECIES: hypothetical protein [Cyanobium]MCP9780220.1 hypothetical protein [Cyanobium sp. To12R1]PSJ05982.1 hypothetical protein C7K55_06015 [Cyanobium usitatum str. Tous]